MDSEKNRAEVSNVGKSGESELTGEEAAGAFTTPAAAPSRGKKLRGRGVSRSKTGVLSIGLSDQGLVTSGTGRVLRDRSARAKAGRHAEDSSNANSQRKFAYPRRRRSTAARVGNSGDVGDDSGLSVDSEEKKDAPGVKAVQSARPRRMRRLCGPRVPSARSSRPFPTSLCKSEPGTEASYVADKAVADSAQASDEEDEVMDEEEASFVDDLTDQNYIPYIDSEEITSEEDLPFRDDLNDQSYEPQNKRTNPKPRRKPAKLPREKKEKVCDKGTDIKKEGGEEMDVKLENEFGDTTEPPRKRGRRRKDDKSPRLPKRRKKPPVQYVRCEMEGCGTVLAHPRYLQHHIKYQHLLKKKYVCPHPSCGRLFRLQKQLLRHAKHHTDQRDYICEYCARAFKSSHNLAVHRMIHTGEKPLQCEICGFTCRQKASLNWHMKKHDADAFYQFSCSICGKKFEKKDSVVAHKAKSHPEVLIAEALAANAGALITTPSSLLAGGGVEGGGSGAEPAPEPVEQVVVLNQGTSLHALQVPISLTLSLPAGSPQLQLLPGVASLAPPSPLPPHSQDLVELDCAISGPPSSGAAPTPQSSASLEQHAISAGEGGMGWQRVDEGGSRPVLLERPEGHVQHETHHELL
ncbi:uncharacterized protein zfp91 [Paramormyrops kingsleyae]|uniref:E3 ubiquitin-protein ligase ZFP91 n=1 Tax=Paramormyrops kingsleyae TaxID=1676925 RepID=A0A3B3QM55_9TELE|nr:E3 ubiquitin-protein ligase ZFP91-like isoform X1 [Paramormyrops kingsleyae]